MDMVEWIHPRIVSFMFLFHYHPLGTSFTELWSFEATTVETLETSWRGVLKGVTGLEFHKFTSFSDWAISCTRDIFVVFPSLFTLSCFFSKYTFM